MESLADQMKKEELTEALWNQVKGWGDRRIINFLVGTLPFSMTEDLVEEISAIPEDERTPREAFSEGKLRADILRRLERATGEDLLDLSKEQLIKEMALEVQIPALEEFTTHLEKSGGEICTTWRPKLVSINVGPGLTDPAIPAVFGYFKTDIDEEELASCYRAYVRQDDWEYEVHIPDGYGWKLNRNLKEADDAVAKSAGWVRYLIGELTIGGAPEKKEKEDAEDEKHS